MENKNKKESLNTEIIADFGEDFGVIARQDIGEVFFDIHASISPLDPLNKD